MLTRKRRKVSKSGRGSSNGSGRKVRFSNGRPYAAPPHLAETLGESSLGSLSQNRVAMSIGYARVSTPEQILDLQVDALVQAGCACVFTDQGSGTYADRQGLKDALSTLESGDTLVVWKLDRLARSVAHLVELLSTFEARGINFRSVTENLDTATPSGRCLFHIIGALAEMERGLVIERVRAGMAAAKRRGKHVGRPFSMTREMTEAAEHLRGSGMTGTEIAKSLGVSRATLYRTMAKVIHL